MEKVIFEKNNKAKYPSREYWFNPSIKYPEYVWGENEVASVRNDVYDMVRNCLCELGLDKEHFGTKDWNPMGDIVTVGNTVLIKPNMVVSSHPELDCIVTHPSILRAIIDYLCIAMGGTGRIIIGDAPMQRCVFKDVTKFVGYDALVDFYSKKGICIELVDFRNYVTDFSSDSVQIVRDSTDYNFVCCDLTMDSMLCALDKRYKRYRVTNYDYRKMRNYHNKQHHKYLIRKEVLEADVIIDIPKVKTHRKAGYTGALKNFVGTVVHKECLPHHVRGSVFTGGNEYLYPNLFKSLRTVCYEQIDLANIYNRKSMIPLLNRAIKTLNRIISKCSLDSYSEGSWYGNDTIWRTFLDINRVIRYADIDGIMHDTMQRKMLVFADMIVAGEKEGPVCASSKQCGLLVAGFNPAAVDYLLVKLMGFDYQKIPALRNIPSIKTYHLLESEYDEIMVSSYSEDIEETNLNSITINERFIPTSGWINYIELENV